MAVDDKGVEEVKEPTAEELQQDQDAFESGFAGAHGDSPAPKPKTEEPQKSTEPEQKTDDPWAGVSPVVKETLEKINTGFTNFSNELKTTAGRVSAIQSAMDAAKAASKSGVDAPTGKQIESAGTSSKKWNELKDDFPQWAEALDERFSLEREAITQPAAFDKDAFRKEIREEFTPVLQHTALAAREAAKLDIQHEGWEATVKTPEFDAWLKTQSAEDQLLVGSVYAKDAGKLISGFKDSQVTQRHKQNKRDRLETAAPAKGTSAGGPQLLDDDDAFENGFYEIRPKAK